MTPFLDDFVKRFDAVSAKDLALPLPRIQAKIMQQFAPTTSFGPKTADLRVVANQYDVRNLVADPPPSSGVAHKWRLFRALTEAKDLVHVTDRDLAVLNALLSCHPETALTLPVKCGRAAEDQKAAVALVVWPSNRELSVRAQGMAPTTLRRHLAALVDAGLISRRDGANGKRFAHKGPNGEIRDAFGFDLTPLVTRAAEIERFADEVRAEKKEISLLRERITLLRRDVAKLIDAAMAENAAGEWQAYRRRFEEISSRHKRRAGRELLEDMAQSLTRLLAEIEIALKNHFKAQKTAASARQNGRLIQNQNIEDSDLEPDLQEVRAEPSPLKPEPSGAATDALPDSAQTVARATPSTSPAAARAYPLGMVLQACPDILDFGRGGEISSWRDLAAAAAIVRPALGVSPDAWTQAIDGLGERDASIAIAAILQRGSEIKSAGGYLRTLTAKARAGEFPLGPMLMALVRSEAAAAPPRWTG